MTLIFTYLKCLDVIFNFYTFSFVLVCGNFGKGIQGTS